MWWRVLLVLAATLFSPNVSRAQAPPASFFDRKSNDELRALASDRANDVLLRRAAATRLVMTLADEGDVDAAADAARTFAKNIDPFAVKHVEAVRRRKRVHAGALGALAIAIASVAASLVAGRRALPGAVRAARRVAPVAVSFFLYAGVVGGCLASSYENGSPWPFVLFAALMLPLVLVFRMWSAVGSRSVAARALRAAAAVAATLAVGFLVVERVDPSYLEGFGL